jgi:hypothetical protein
MKKRGRPSGRPRGKNSDIRPTIIPVAQLRAMKARWTAACMLAVGDDPSAICGFLNRKYGTRLTVTKLMEFRKNNCPLL